VLCKTGEVDDDIDDADEPILQGQRPAAAGRRRRLKHDRLDLFDLLVAIFGSGGVAHVALDAHVHCTRLISVSRAKVSRQRLDLESEARHTTYLLPAMGFLDWENPHHRGQKYSDSFITRCGGREQFTQPRRAISLPS
jgi:hypothetical protein